MAIYKKNEFEWKNKYKETFFWSNVADSFRPFYFNYTRLFNRLFTFKRLIIFKELLVFL